VGSELEKSPGVVAGFSGSYTSAVGMALLKKSYSGPIDPAFVCVKDEIWRMDLAEAWLTRLGYTTDLVKVIFNETVDDLEDQVPSLKRGRDACRSIYVSSGLSMLAVSKGRSVAWLGDRNAAALGGLPSSQAHTLAPLADLCHHEVRQLGSFLSVDERWVEGWGGVPGNWVQSEAVRVRKLDQLVGWVAAHREDIQDAHVDPSDGEVALRGSSNGFQWMGWVPEDAFDRVKLGEIVEQSKLSEWKPARKPVSAGSDLEALNFDYTLSLTGTPPKELTVLGSVRVAA
ncbi:unnamed protein product, partial [marine sediment metagenome]